ncbi:MAG: MFS transporter [Bacillota bacterium]|nr:MFS transporter [Bacillota bacterium]
MNNLKKRAFQLIITLGIISLLGDIIYEGARGVSGQYLQTLGVSATTVGFIVGLGELLGYLFRLASGFFADKTKSYWLFTIVGYGLLISIPLIALTGIWQIVAVLIIFERIGKGVRTPARDTIASHASKQIGSGYAFGIAEFLDQIGAVIGPLIFSLVLLRAVSGQNLIATYQQGFSFTWIPYILLLGMLWFAYTHFKNSEELEIAVEQKSDSEKKLPKVFWLYALFVFITTIGFISFALVGFHLKKYGILNDAYIPLLYAVAMGAVDAIAGLAIGKLYDKLNKRSGNHKRGLVLLLAIPISAALVPIFIFSKTLAFIIVGTVLFGFGMGLQEVIMKAAVADMTPLAKRATAYGIFNLSLGLAFFVGGTLAGFLYDYSIPILIIFLTAVELMAIPVFYMMKKMIEDE